jgi:RHS repeat-associated protein
VELDPWGGETGRSSNQSLQPHRYTSYERDNNGGDEAMMRRYESQWQRFAQPDPYAGSYDLSNPQSFNRYAYVQNDPVNFTDPSGLFALPPDETIRVYTWERDTNAYDNFLRESRRLFWDSMRRQAGESVGGLRNGGHEGAPQDTVPRQEISDCVKFADMVQTIANEVKSVAEFLDRMASTFTAANNSSFTQMRITANNPLPPGRPVFGSSGFKEKFRDPSNQVRHFVGGFIAVARSGWPGYEFMQLRENSSNSEDDADRRLNGESAGFASRFINQPYESLAAIRKLFAQQIRERICE